MRILLLVLLLTLFAGCGQMQVAEHDVGLVRHYVKKGETLYAIARHYNVDFQEMVKNSPRIPSLMPTNHRP